MELELLKLELEAKRLETAARPARINKEVVRQSSRIARLPELPAFVDGRDDLDKCLLRFERYATVAGWEKEAWGTQLSQLLSGRALEVYSRLSQDEAMDYERLKLALLKRYDFTKFRYRRRFRDAKPEGQESPDQFIVQLKNYLTKWVKLARVEKSFDGVVELMVREQFTNACPKELSVYLNERSPKTLDELATWADQYLMAHNKKLSSKNAIGRGENLNVDKSERSPERPGKLLNCYRCGGEGQRAMNCMSKIPDGCQRSGDRRILCSDVVDLDTKRATAASGYPVGLPHDLDPVEPSLQCKFIEWDVLFSFGSATTGAKRRRSGFRTEIRRVNQGDTCYCVQDTKRERQIAIGKWKGWWKSAEVLRDTECTRVIKKKRFGEPGSVVWDVWICNGV